MIVRNASSAHLQYRWNFPITCLCCHVRHASLSVIMGGRSSSCSKSSLLYFAKRWLLDSDQGEFCVRELGQLCVPVPRAFVLHHNEACCEGALCSYVVSQEYESIYKASVAVAGFPQGQMQRVVSRRKRDDDDDEEEIRCVHFWKLSPVLCVH